MTPGPALLDLDEILQESLSVTGLDDFGGDDLLEALRVLVPSLNAEADFTSDGVQGKRAGLVRALCNRLRLQNALNEHPEIRDEPIAGPLVIVGLPRSGTTKLHRMIAADPAMQKLPLWRILNPVPLEATASSERDPRFAVAEAFEAAMRERLPALQAAHPMVASEPDEDVFALEITGRMYINCSASRAPTYKAWLDQQSFDGVYRWLRLYLQIIQYYDRGRGRPWILKAPQHMGFLPQLFDHFPAATVIHCHRSVSINIASYAAMITTARRAVSSVADPLDVGRYAIDFWSDLMRRYLRDRVELEELHRFVDISYPDIVENGMKAISRIYADAAIELTEESKLAMSAWESNNAQHKHGRHQYSLADAGLTEAQVASAFSEYTARFSSYI